MKNFKAYALGLFTAMFGHKALDMVASLVPATYSNDVYYLGGGLVLLAVGYVVSLFYVKQIGQKE